MPNAHVCCGSVATLAPRPFALPGTARVFERARPFVIQHIALDIALGVDKKEVTGSAAIDFRRVDRAATRLQLDAVGFEISAVELAVAGAAPTAAEHVYDGQTLSVTVPGAVEQGTVRVIYRARPDRGLYFLAPDEHVRDRPHQVWTQCQDEDARYWFPCHDKPHVKMTFDLAVRVPRGWTALSNGVQTEAERNPAEGSWRFVWKMADALPSYLVTLVAGEFSEIDAGSVDGVPITYLVPKGREDDGRRSFGRTPEMVKRFGELLGVRYPWNKYAQVVVSDFIFGGMENTSATTMYEYVLLDERAALDITSDDIVAHELAHQWFGDYVTCRDWSHAWLNEGFATFFEHIDIEDHKGRDEYDYAMQGSFHTYLAEAHGRYQRPIVSQEYEAPIDLFDRHLYQKGGLVLHMLRAALGNDVFWRAVRTYLERHARSIVETRDLMRALEDVSGRALEQFFEQWVYRPGHPVLEVKIEHEGTVLNVSVTQKQPIDKDHPAFVFPFTVLIVDEHGRAERHTRQVVQASESIALSCPERPSFVVADPDFDVIAEITLDAPLDMLRRQLASGPSARTRWLAAPPLAKRSDLTAIESLRAALADDAQFWGVRAEAARALGDTRLEAASAILIAHASTAHPKVRRAVAQALGQFRTAQAADALKKLTLSDPSYLVEADAARALGATRRESAFDTLVEVLDRPSWADVLRAGAIDGLAALHDERALPHLLARTRYGVKTRGRRAAMMALAKLTSDRKHREALAELLDDWDPHVRTDVVRALVEMGDPKARPVLEGHFERERDGRVRRRIREALQELTVDPKTGDAELRETLDKLKSEHAELQAQVKRLEAALPAATSAGPAEPAPAPASASSARPRSAKASRGQRSKGAQSAATHRKAKG